MHISKNFIMRPIAGENVIVPIGEEASRFQGLITVNESGAFLWKLLQDENTSPESIKQAFRKEYGVDEKTADNDVEEFLHILRMRNILKEE